MTGQTRTAVMMLLCVLFASACSHLSSTHKITQVSITQAGCGEECPRYSATLHADGRVDYSGEAAVPFVGEWGATMQPGDFKLLADLMAREQYFAFRDIYGEEATHYGPTTTSAVRGGVRKTTVNHGVLNPAGPLSLQWIEAAIEIVIRRAENWTQIAPKVAP